MALQGNGVMSWVKHGAGHWESCVVHLNENFSERRKRPQHGVGLSLVSKANKACPRQAFLSVFAVTLPAIPSSFVNSLPNLTRSTGGGWCGGHEVAAVFGGRVTG